MLDAITDEEIAAIELSKIEFACQVLNIMFYKVPRVVEKDDENGEWWVAELRDKNILIKWNKEKGEFEPIKGGKKDEKNE